MSLAAFAIPCGQAGRVHEAQTAIRQLPGMNAAQPGAQYLLGVILLAEGDPAAALAAFQAETGAGWTAYGLALGFRAMHRDAEADAVLAELLQRAEGSQF